MAAPTFTLINHTLLDDADDNTGWNDLVLADADILVEGNASMSGIFRATGDQGYYDHGSAPSTGVGKTVRGWIVTNNLAYMETEAAGGYQLIIYDGTTEELKTVFGSDTYPGGWFNYVWDMDDFTTVTLANVQRWGIEGGHASSAKNATNTWMDAIRYLDGYSMVGGTSGDKVEVADIATLDKVDAYNVISVSPDASNVFFGTGTIQFGNGATTHYFESDGDVLTFKDLPIAAGLYSLSGVGTGANVVIKNGLYQAAGTTDDTRFAFDWSDTDLASFSLTDHTIRRAAAVTFKSGQTATGNTFDDCGQITHAGADMDDCVVQGYEGTAGTAALTYDVAVDPDGETDNMAFTMGTALTHAIELGTNTPSSITLRGWTVSGYSTSNGVNNSVIYNNSGKSITVNVIDGTGTFSYRNGTSASTIIVVNPVSLSVHVQDGDTAADISGARVYVLAATTGPLPFEDTVTITRVTTTATVVHTAHGLATDQWMKIENADQEEYNGAKQITKIDDDSYSYTVAGTPTTPATGTINATAVIIFGTTDVNGDISDSRSYASDQDFTGRIRKSSASPYYKTFDLSGTIDSTNGLPLTVGMNSDE